MTTAGVPMVLDLPTPLTRRRSRRRWVLAILVLSGLAVALGSLLRPTAHPPTEEASPLAQTMPFVHVASVIVAEPSTPTPLPIHVGPSGVILQGGWLTLLGLPPLASLSEGQAIAPGSWKVPAARLPHLMITPPSGEGLRSTVTVALASPEGAVLAESQSVLVVIPASQFVVPRREVVGTQQPEVEPIACPEMALSASYASDGPSAPATRQEIKERAQRLAQLGDGWLANGNVAAARNFYQRAMDLGSASAAFALAATYDPHELPRRQLTGVIPDLQKARCCYQRARELAQAEASYYLKRLEPRQSTQVRSAENSSPIRPASGP